MPDWLLIYEIDGKKIYLYLTSTGTHSDFFYFETALDFRFGAVFLWSILTTYYFFLLWRGF